MGPAEEFLRKEFDNTIARMLCDVARGAITFKNVEHPDQPGTVMSHRQMAEELARRRSPASIKGGIGQWTISQPNCAIQAHRTSRAHQFLLMQ